MTTRVNNVDCMSEVTEILGMAKYVFDPLPKTVNKEEWEDMKYKVHSYFFNNLLRAYKAGYLKGSELATKAMGHEWSEEDACVGAQRCFDAWGKI